MKYFMIGPSISVLIDGYVEKNNRLVRLRGTLVPAKTLNNLVSKIPVVGDILVGEKVGEGIFGLSFKIKGQPDNLKTTVNPVKTLAPRFITRAIEAAKKENLKNSNLKMSFFPTDNFIWLSFKTLSILIIFFFIRNNLIIYSDAIIF